MNRLFTAGIQLEALTHTILKVAVGLILGMASGRIWATDAALLPPVATVIERAWVRAQMEPENDRAFNATYVYARSKATEYKNARGHLNDRKEKNILHRPATPPGDFTNSTTAVFATRTNIVSSDAAANKRALLGDTNLINRFTFELQGREIIDGRPALIVDFKPSTQKLPTSSIKDRLLNKAAGRVWVDEEEYALVKAEVRLTESVSVFGGLVGTVHKFKFSFGRERMEDGLWYTRLLTWHLEARELIVERVIDCVETKTDVRKAQ